MFVHCVDKYHCVHGVDSCTSLCPVYYTTLLRFWKVYDLTELTDGHSGCEVARGGCSFVRNFSLKKSAVLIEADRRH